MSGRSKCLKNFGNYYPLWSCRTPGDSRAFCSGSGSREKLVISNFSGGGQEKKGVATAPGMLLPSGPALLTCAHSALGPASSSGCNCHSHHREHSSFEEMGTLSHCYSWPMASLWAVIGTREIPSQCRHASYVSVTRVVCG